MYNNNNNGFELGNELEFGYEFNNEFSQEFNNEFGLGNEFNLEFGNEYPGEMNESLELELANELLSVTNEQELNYFLGKLIKTVGKGIGDFARSNVGRMIGGALKSVAKTALPFAGKALGSFVGGPIGGMLGGKLGSLATRLFELELEGLSPEDREFEVAKAYIRFANDAIQRGASISRDNPSAAPAQIAKAAIKQSAEQHAPGLIRKNNTSNTSQSTANRQISNGGLRANKGTWIRRGKSLILYEM